MKKIAFILISILIVSCATETNNDEVIRELAKKDIIEKLELPEGTKFNNEDFEITENNTDQGSLGVTYIVKVTIKSQDKKGDEIIKIHTMNYKKLDAANEAAEDYELTSFE